MKLSAALNDFLSGLMSWRVWWRLALLTNRELHKRSILGPIWNTVGTLVMILLFGLLYASMLGYQPKAHLPYVASGLIIWIFYSEIITKSCSVFVSHTIFIQQMNLPKSIYIFRVIASEVISFSYAFILILVPVLIWGEFFSWKIIVAALGFVLVVFNALAVGIVLSVISLRYRDVAPMVAHVMRPLLFITPIIWNVDKFPDRVLFIQWNPFFHLVEVFRAPLLCEIASLNSYLFVISFTLISFIIAISIFTRYRARIAYWV